MSVFMLMITCFSFDGYAQAEPHEKLVAITFDDGPGPYTEQLLDGLKARGAKATFFTIGENVARYKDTIQRMRSEGHQIGTHTMTHVNLASKSAQVIRDELQKATAVLTEYAGEGVYYLRPPYGSLNQTVINAVDVPMVLWSVDTLDWKLRNTEKVYQKILKDTSDGDIILLHDLYKTSVEAALRAIDTLQAEGYRFLTVEELLKSRGITPQNGQVYRSAYYKGVEQPLVHAPVIAVKYTVLGAKVIIQAADGAEMTYYSRDSKYEKIDNSLQLSFYVSGNESVCAVSVENGNLSALAKTDLSMQDISQETLDRAYYHYAVPFLRTGRKFRVGMKMD